MQMLDSPAQILVLALVLISMGLWVSVIWRWRQFGWPLPFRLRRPVPWQLSEAVVVIVVVLFVVTAGLQQIFARPVEQSGVLAEPGYSLRQIQVQCLSQVVGLLFIPSVLSLWHLCYWGDFGLSRREVLIDLRSAVWGVLLAVLPVGLLLWPLQSLRADSPHPILELLARTQDHGPTLAWIVLEVVVLAPLIEELLFRVILQGALSRDTPPYVAILLSSTAFVMIHQSMADWPPLFPLALILGYVYYRRQSYLAAVVLHGLFNAANLMLALSAVPKP